MKFGLEQHIIDSIIAIFEQNSKVDKAYVFGSRAKGNYRPDSDIDIALKGQELTHKDIIHLSGELDELNIGFAIDLLNYYTINEPTLKDHIDRVGIELYSRWKEYKLLELGKVVTGNTPSSKFPEEFGNEMPFVTPTDYKNYNKWIFVADRNLSDKGINKLKSRVLPANSILVTCIGSDMGKVGLNKIPVVTNQQINSIIINEKVNPDFLYYKMITSYDILRTYGEAGTAVPIVNKGDFKNIEITIPSDVKEQTAIASIFSSLDDKIDLLHRQNKTLEQLAETLFRQWFVAEAEESWEVGTLGDLVVVKYGKDHKKLLNGNIPMFGSGGLMRKVNRALYESESVLIPRKGTLNNVMYLDEPFWTVDTMFYTEMKKENLSKFIYHFLKGQDLASMNVGSAVPSMTAELLNKMIIKIPSNFALKRFEETVSYFYKKMKSNQTQIHTLTQTRDALLPKLMSGEVRVI